VASVVRSAVLNNYVEIALSVGLEPHRLLKLVGLSPSCLLDPDIKIDTEAVVRLLEISAGTAGIDDFGLRMALTRRLSNLGPICLLVREEPTVRKALESLFRYLALHNESMFMRIEESGGFAVLKEVSAAGRRAGVRQGMELALGSLHRMLRELLDEGWRPRRICFTHSAPARLVTHHKVFGPRVEFACEFNGIACRAEDLDAPVPHADPVMARYARQHLDAMLERPNVSTSDRVRQLIWILLPAGRCSIEQVAQHLGVDRRTIHRHLAGSGETFSAAVNAVRTELAKRYVESSQRPLSEVADLLGYSAQSAFARWFRSEFGCSVSSWRAARARSLKA
jgi:AraC-like DNA-binding protein